MLPDLANLFGISIDELYSHNPVDSIFEEKYDIEKIRKFKKRMLFSVALLFTPVFSLLGTLAENSDIFFLFLGIGITLVALSICLVINICKEMKYTIDNEYNCPKYTIILKNYLITYLFVMYLIIGIILSSLNSIVLGVLAYTIWCFLLFSVFIYLPLKIKKKKFICLLIGSNILAILSFSLMAFKSFLPYYSFLLISQIFNYSNVFSQNDYSKWRRL